jgi:DNA-binding response OmpR family regulator
MTNKLPALLVDPAGREIPLLEDTLSIGRAEESDVPLAHDRRVSRQHAELRRQGAAWVLHDLNSTNGTFVNEQRLTAPCPLRDGDAIRIGEATFTFSDPEATIRESAFPLLVYDARTGELWVNRQSVSLSAKEHDLFRFLYDAEGRLCAKDEIGQAVWPEYRGEVFDYQIESLVKRLREKLEPNPREPALLLTIRGRGYRLVRDT